MLIMNNRRYNDTPAVIYMDKIFYSCFAILFSRYSLVLFVSRLYFFLFCANQLKDCKTIVKKVI